MRTLRLVLRALAFSGVLSIPVVVPFLVFRRPYFALAAAAAVFVACFLDHLRSFGRMRARLDSRPVDRFGVRLHAYRFPAGAFFLSAHPFRRGIQVWIREDLLEKLPEEDLKTLIRKFRSESHRGELLLETYVTRWIHRALRVIPRRTREFIAGRAPPADFELAFPLWTVFFLGVVGLWKSFVAGDFSLAPGGEEESRIRHRIARATADSVVSSAESRGPIESLSLLSVFPLYPTALLDYGRPCLWRGEGLEITG